jgi:DnaJ family protein A protein 2
MDAMQIYEVHIDPGMREGQRITFQGEADESPGIEPGDLVVVLQQKSHDVFVRDGMDLRYVLS